MFKRLDKIVTGVTNEIKELTGLLEEEVAILARERVAKCYACEHLKRTVGLNRCGLCGCVVELKTKVSTESCPDGRW